MVGSGARPGVSIIISILAFEKGENLPPEPR